MDTKHKKQNDTKHKRTQNRNSGSSVAFGRCSLVPNGWEVLDQT
jgi:hypothetical protein